MRVSWLSLSLLLSVGCSNSVSGRVDGDPVGGARGAIFDEVAVQIPLIGELAVAVILLSDIPDACEVFEELIDAAALTCDDSCDALVEEKQRIPGDAHWSTVLIALNDGGFEETYDYAGVVPGPGQFTASFSSYDFGPLRSEDTCVDTCEDGDDPLGTEVEDGNDGSLEITRAEDDLLQGSFEVELGGDDRIQGRFSAEPCNLADLFL